MHAACGVFIYSVFIYFFGLVTGYCTGFLHMTWSQPVQVKDPSSSSSSSSPLSLAEALIRGVERIQDKQVNVVRCLKGLSTVLAFTSGK